jgi:hypothetical protein
VDAAGVLFQHEHAVVPSEKGDGDRRDEIIGGHANCEIRVEHDRP